MGGVEHELVSGVENLLRECGAKKQGLLSVRGLLEDPQDIREESHVQHAVRLVEAEVLNVLELEVPPFGHVNHSPRGSDNDVGAFVEFLRLLLKVGASVDGLDRQPLVSLQTVNLLCDLHGELPSWTEDDGLRRARGRATLKNRDSECGCLSRAGPRLPYDVHPLSSRRQCLPLNLGRLGPAKRLDGCGNRSF